MKKIYTSLFLLASLAASAQQQAKTNSVVAVPVYGNEWINYSQKFYKFPITQDGVYRLDSTALANSGINLSSINPKNFQIFGRGAETPIYVQGEADGIFNGADYIEFYAQKNDGFADAPLYPAGLHPNPYYSLINDTANYFLTWNTSTTNLRFASITDTDFSSFTPVSYFLKEVVYANPVSYIEGYTTGYGSTDPTYDKTEGWFSGAFYMGDVVNYPISTPYVFSGGPDATAKMNLVGASNNYRHLVIEYLNAGSSYVQLQDISFYGFELLQLSDTIPASQLGAVTDFKVSSINVPWGGNYSALCFIDLKYPHTLDMEGASTFKFFLNDHLLQTKSYLNFSNYTGTGAIHLYDLTNNKRFDVFPNGVNYRALVPNSSSEKTCFLFGDNQVTSITSVVPVTPSATFTDYSTVVSDSAFLIITNKLLMTDAMDYKNYRQSSDGRSHNVVIADVDELYDQFAFGIKKHPLSIRNFCDFAINTWNTPPKNLFLIGKSIVAASIRNDTYNYANSLLPAIGNPPCDNLFTSGLNGTLLEPAIPTGRIAAKNSADVQAYLSKIIEYEKPLLSGEAPPEWKKRVMHFAGGSDTYQQILFQQYVNIFKATIQDTCFGGIVHSFFKTTSAPIQLTLTDSVKNLFNNGVSILTFFGHAAGSGFEQSLDAASNYSNQGKYPMMIANACFVGNIHQPVYQTSGGQTFGSTSEDYVLIPNKGAIGFLAAVGLGIASSLFQYTDNLYKNIGQKLYGKTIGECIKKTIIAVQGPGTEQTMRNTVLEMTLHGDPAIIINSFAQPDYAVSEPSIYFTDKNNTFAPITTVMDSFNVNVVVTNLGKSTNDSVNVEIIRDFPAGNSIVYNRSLPYVHFRDTLKLTLPVDKINGGGLNTFSVRVDPPNFIAELSESNNDVLLAPLYILSGDIVPIYPYKYAIVPNDTVTLKAFVGNPFAPTLNYRFEIDTTDLFNSMELRFKIISHAGGGIVEWANPTTLKDSIVYFWRVRRDTIDTTNFKWNESSFQYINNKRGWEQAHFFQYKNDDYAFIKYNRPARTFDFTSTGTKLICHNYGNPYQLGAPADATQWQLDFKLQDWGGCTGYAIYIAVVDPATLKAWGTHAGSLNPTHEFGDYKCNPNILQKIFIFQTRDTAQMAGLKNMLTNGIPDGHYILAYSWIQGDFQKWADTSLYSTFINLGADANIRNLPDSIPYIFFTKKGDASTTKEVIGTSSTAYINLAEDLVSNLQQGTIYSELIGPAARWDSLSWRQMPLEAVTQDSIRVNVIGVRANGVEDVVMQGLVPGVGGDVYLSPISTDIYPYLKLNAYIKDDSLLTPAQLLKWQVFYQPAPEVAVNSSKWFSFQTDTMQEGDNLKFHVAVENVSDFYMDSMLVKFWIQDANRVNHYLTSYMSKPLPTAGDTLSCSIVVPTLGYPGANTLWMEINPVGQPKERNEQYHFNNIAVVGFFVGKDLINPMLDVTFDGIHILNGDIVSAKPNIFIKLKDENTFLALNDPSDFAVFIKKPGDVTSIPIKFGSELSFTPAVLPNNSCKINYTPSFLQDGTYELIVQAKDRSNNLSGNIDYKIQFEIVNKPTVTEVLNYPNPFSTSTKFVFTLTGVETPQYFKIQIMTITGKVVREITKEELGYIHIGRNITEYAWNGKDDFGDQLANGIYLYRVMTQLNGQAVEHKETEADQYFNKGFGKMYLMR